MRMLGKVSRGGVSPWLSEIEVSLAKRNRGQIECPVIQDDLPENFNDNDIRYERTEQLGGGKYLRESCYHHIECSATNSLAVLMRK